MNTIDISKYQFVKQVDTIENSYRNPNIENSNMVQQEQEKKFVSFMAGEGVPKNHHYMINPYVIEEKVLGYVRYSYIINVNSASTDIIVWFEMIILSLFISGLLFLLYIKRAILKPFHEIIELPYELSKGHLQYEIKESKNRYFGRFLWGLELLRKHLEDYKRKELELERDKKLLILSISHDIKTPLSTIKLYAKALYEDLYPTEEKRHHTARQIEANVNQIEQFVSDIITTSSTELFHFDVNLEEFYLSKLINRITDTYYDKLALIKTEFHVINYKDKLLHGDFDKLIDVFDNLFQNAMKYGDGKGIYLSFEEEDNCQLIRVTNSGNPIPQEEFVHMFESFWRGANSTGKQGSGLGLYICKQLLHKMGGDIYAESKVDSMSLVVVIKKG
jgi:signal transduction histidine kinase